MNPSANTSGRNAALSRTAQISMAGYDTLGACVFAGSSAAVNPVPRRCANAASSAAPSRRINSRLCGRAIARVGDRIAVGLDVRGTTLAARGCVYMNQALKKRAESTLALE